VTGSKLASSIKGICLIRTAMFNTAASFLREN
jgi:hypothetical protein